MFKKYFVFGFSFFLFSSFFLILNLDLDYISYLGDFPFFNDSLIRFSLDDYSNLDSNQILDSSYQTKNILIYILISLILIFFIVMLLFIWKKYRRTKKIFMKKNRVDLEMELKENKRK